MLISSKHVIGSLESIVSSALDRNDNLLVLGTTDLHGQFIAKYDSEYHQIWRQELDSTFTVTAWAVTRAGEILLGGDVAGQDGTGHAACLMKWDMGGTLAWTDVWTTGPSSVTAIAEGPDGDVYATGSPGTLLPGYPSNEQLMYDHQAFIERFDAAGNRKSLIQYTGIVQGYYRTAIPNSLFVDDGGNSFMGITLDTTGYLRSVAADGTFIADTLLTDTAHGLSILGGRTPFDADQAAWAPDQKAIYSLQEISTDAAVGNNLQGVLAKVGLDGALLWYRSTAVQSGVLDTTVNGQWTGAFTRLSVVTATSDALYVAGHYSDVYAGDNPPASIAPGFLARYDLDGNQEWFDRMLLDLSMVSADMRSAPNAMAAININSKGNPVLIINGAVSSAAPGGGDTIAVGWYAVEFDATDGS